MYARMQLADAYDSTYACSRSMEASKQYHGSMQAAELWKHASSRTMVAWKQQNYGSMEFEAAEPWKHANNRTEACKQQNYGCMQAAEPWIVAAYSTCS